MDEEKVGAHYAVSSLFESYPETARIYSFTVDQLERQVLSAGNARLALGRARVRFEITRRSDEVTYGVLHLGDHNLNCGVRKYQGPEPYQELIKDMREAFDRAEFPQIIRLMDRHFGESHYSLKNLFKDEQRRVLDQILATTRDDIHNSYRLITDRYAPLLRFLADLPAPAPTALRLAHEFVVNSELRRQFDHGVPDAERLQSLLHEAEVSKVALDKEVLAYAFKAHLDRVVDRWQNDLESLDWIQQLTSLTTLLQKLPFEVNLWKPQNVYFTLKNAVYSRAKLRADEGDNAARVWLQQFTQLGEQLGFRSEAA
jgi:hypothetical protein